MRIIAGELRSRIIETLPGDNTRPTQDKLRGAIFSSIGSYFQGQSFLDLFSGSGACGIEAKSRGCDFVVMNDNNRSAFKIISKNIANLKIDCDVYNLDYKQVLSKFKDFKFDYIFLDPPYNLKIIEEILMIIDDNNMISENGKIIIESSVKDSYDKLEFKNIQFIKCKDYRLTRVSYFSGLKKGVE